MYKILKNVIEMDDYSIQRLGSRRKLPKEYQKVDYIESSGTQYIDIGVIPNNTTAYKMKISVLNENGADKIIFGSRTGDQRFWLDFDGTSSDSRILVGYGQYSYIMKYNLDTVYNISFNTNQNKKFIVNDNEFDILTDYDSTNALPLYLFKTNYRTGYSGNFRIYNFKLYDNNTIIRNYIPVYRKSDNEVGLYDLVNDVFYSNQGTGEFGYEYKGEKVDPTSATRLQANVANVNSTLSTDEFEPKQLEKNSFEANDEKEIKDIDLEEKEDIFE